MKKSFTLVELIFVIIIIAILSGTAFYSYKTKNLEKDTDFVYMNLLQARYAGINGLGIDGLNDENRSCFNPDSVKELAGREGYEFKSSVEGSRVCFDRYGEGYVDGVPLQQPEIVTLSYGEREKNITILPKSGYVIILQ